MSQREQLVENAAQYCYVPIIPFFAGHVQKNYDLQSLKEYIVVPRSSWTNMQIVFSELCVKKNIAISQ